MAYEIGYRAQPQKQFSYDIRLVLQRLRES